MGYLAIVAIATVLDMATNTENEEKRFFRKMLQAFSIPKNWNRLKTIKVTPDVERLRVIQGIRFYNMVLVILTHTIMFTFMLPISNTNMTETVSIQSLYTMYYPN